MITDDRALQTMLKMHTDGATYEQIAEKLKAAGYKGKRSGKALTSANVGNYVRKHAGEPETTLPTATAPNAIPTSMRIDLAIKVLTEDAWGDDYLRTRLAIKILQG